VAQTLEEMFNNKFIGIPIVHPSVMAKVDWFKRWPYDKHNIRSEDYELWLRSLKNNVFANIADILCFKNESLSYALSKYAHSKHTGAKFIWRYAPEEIGRILSAYYARWRYMQIAIYAACNLLGLRDLFIQHRYLKLTPQEREEAEKIANIIKNTKLPLKKLPF